MVANLPADIGNQALDAAGIEFTFGDLTQGGREAEVVLRAYSQCLRQLLRSAHWDMARKQVALTLLADATGQTAEVGTDTLAPWIYTYAYPPDCMKARFLPANACPLQPPAGNYALPDVPLTAIPIAAPITNAGRLIPAPFLVSLDVNNAIDADSNWIDVQGESPVGRVVILSNVSQARLVYTSFMPYPSVWDSQFRGAFVAYLAAEIALPLSKDKKFGLEMRDRNMRIAKDKVMAARVSNGNESGFPQTVDHLPDWMAIRNIGGGATGNGPNCGLWGSGGWGWDGVGFLGYGWDGGVF